MFEISDCATFACRAQEKQSFLSFFALWWTSATDKRVKYMERNEASLLTVLDVWVWFFFSFDFANYWLNYAAKISRTRHVTPSSEAKNRFDQIAKDVRPLWMQFVCKCWLIIIYECARTNAKGRSGFCGVQQQHKNKRRLRRIEKRFKHLAISLCCSFADMIFFFVFTIHFFIGQREMLCVRKCSKHTKLFCFANPFLFTRIQLAFSLSLGFFRLVKCECAQRTDGVHARGLWIACCKKLNCNYTTQRCAFDDENRFSVDVDVEITPNSTQRQHKRNENSRSKHIIIVMSALARSIVPFQSKRNECVSIDRIVFYGNFITRLRTFVDRDQRMMHRQSTSSRAHAFTQHSRQENERFVSIYYAAAIKCLKSRISMENANFHSFVSTFVVVVVDVVALFAHIFL